MGLTTADKRTLAKAEAAVKLANEHLIDALAGTKAVLTRVHKRGEGKSDTHRNADIARDVATFDTMLNKAIEQLHKVEEQAGKCRKA